MKLEYKKCPNIDLKEVILYTMSFGSVKLPFELTNSDELAVQLELLGELQLKWLVDKDIRMIEKQNAHEDSDHQVDLSTLTLRGIEITEGVCPTVRLHYMFRQDDDFWRKLAGETGSLKKLDESLKIYRGAPGWYCIPLYTKGMFVPW